MPRSLYPPWRILFFAYYATQSFQNDAKRRSTSLPIHWLGLAMSLSAVPVIFAKRKERARNSPITLFGSKFMSNVPVDSKADLAIMLVGTAGRKLILAFLV